MFDHSCAFEVTPQNAIVPSNHCNSQVLKELLDSLLSHTTRLEEVFLSYKHELRHR